ncbi:MAG: PSD1 domain-containing protein [Planctomyces sp.]|nr:PSD1 domain-containing protein [Planctomyces sp.]
MQIIPHHVAVTVCGLAAILCSLTTSVSAVNPPPLLATRQPVQSQPVQSQPEQAQTGQARSGPQLIATNCIDCHHPGDASGGLDLTTHEAAVRGGDSGSAVSTSNPLESHLWLRIQSDEMPPEHPLSVEQKQVIRTWLLAGAQWPETPMDRFAASTFRRAGRDWWSLQPLQPQNVPSIEDSSWCQNELDHFVLARLHQEGLSPSPRASARTLVRRLYYDLTGLPPTIEKVKSFAASIEHSSPEATNQAWGLLVDEVLSTNQYGEHWANHWLDIARFGESHGFEYNQPRDGAWHYRNWVIQALNADLPYDQFAAMQIAGDSFSTNELDQFRPLGFLVSGTHNTVVGQSDEMRQTVRQEELEEIAGTLSQAFLGLTMNCARCHDHKFDPITTREYYQFVASLAGIRHGNRNVSRLSPDQQRIAVEQLAEINQRLREARLQSGLRFSNTENRANTTLPATANQPGTRYQLSFDLSPTVWAGASQATRDDDQLLVRLVGSSKQTIVSQAFSPGGWDRAAEQQVFRRCSLEYEGDGSGPLTLQLLPVENTGRFAGAVARMRIEDPQERTVWQETFQSISPDPAPGIQAATGLKVHCRCSLPGWTFEGLNAAHAVEFLPGEFALQLFSASEDIPFSPELLATNSLPASSEVAALIDIMTRRSELEQRIAGTSIFTVVSEQPTSVHILRRGDVRQKDEEVRPGGVRAVSGPEPNFGLTSASSDPERRRQLAAWITSPENGLFHRVIVNRVWHYHFGQGLLEKTSDFGFNGGHPSHPELLEWLAIWFQQNGCSLKKLHRLILTSATWQQTSLISNPTLTEQDNSHDAEIGKTTVVAALQKDGRNRWLWRQNSRRLDAECLRDSILSAAGSLSLESFDKGWEDFSVETIGAAHYYRHSEELQRRIMGRSVYRFRVRGDRSPLMESFDCPDPSVTAPVRNVTTTPTQALSLWNNSLVIEMSKRLSEKIRQQCESGAESTESISVTTACVNTAWEIVLQRTPNDEECDAAIVLVRDHGLEHLCRVLFNTNEFLVVD